MNFASFTPAWWPRLRQPGTLRADALAGLLSALLVLPQGIAFATLAGLPPQYGLYSAVLPCIVAALAGSSWHVVTGPTNANSLALAAMLAPLALRGSPGYVELALALTLLVGALQFATGALRLGAIAHFISPTALLGFASGAALLIVWHALPDALGLPADALHQPLATVQAWTGAVADGHTSPAPGALVVSGLTLALAAGLRRWRPRWPFMLIALVAGTALGALLQAAVDRGALGAAWAVAVLGPLPSALPPLHWPQVPPARWPDLLGLAAALTVVALAQSIAIAKAVAEKSGQRIDANREFLGQGLANLVGGVSGAYVACGSLNRSLPNLEAGARTPLAAVFSGLAVVPLVAFSAPLLARIPLAAVAGLLMLVGWTLLAPASWRQLARASRAEWTIAALTLVATLVMRLELAVLVGSALSLGAYLQRTARPSLRSMGFDRPSPPRHFVVLDGRPAGDSPTLPECPQLKLLRMEGSVYFGATAHVSDHLQALRDSAPAQRHLLVMAKSMNFVDVAGSAMWRQELRARRAQGGDLYFHRPRPDVVAQWRRDGLLAELGEDHLFQNKAQALATIVHRLQPEGCAACPHRVFTDCDQRPGAALHPVV
ncbi:SulP family inorganic anion transporter [Ideonella livida]|uniref:SulP family inorganic anion transporter n=1 Tax=Ideonella livida TaxID=2707176 RepID=A0A7C9PHF6_9BURK|nr:SulP family inorganic anion transporter [Ideonella livida]NDY92077.1 SulP family inorganic anion transporter [Ideonella livida]